MSIEEMADNDHLARAMLHLQDSLPRFFEHGHTSADMFPPEIFSQQIVLKLPPPLPFKVNVVRELSGGSSKSLSS